MQEMQLGNSFSLVPTNLNEAMEYAKLIANSDIVPKDLKGKPGNVLVAIQMGMELGLKPLQAIQNIAVINGKPSIYGDSALAIVMNHPKFESIDEREENGVAYCTVKRQGMEPQTRTFSIEEAKKAGLIERSPVWKAYQSRMLQMRARGFAIRDVFPDALRGMITREEAQDYIVIQENSAPKKTYAQSKPVQKKELAVDINIDTGEVLGAPTFEEIKSAIEKAVTIKQLIEAADFARSLPEEQKITIREIYKKKQIELSAVPTKEEENVE